MGERGPAGWGAPRSPGGGRQGGPLPVPPWDGHDPTGPLEGRAETLPHTLTANGHGHTWVGAERGSPGLRRGPVGPNLAHHHLPSETQGSEAKCTGTFSGRQADSVPHLILVLLSLRGWGQAQAGVSGVPAELGGVRPGPARVSPLRSPAEIGQGRAGSPPAEGLRDRWPEPREEAEQGRKRRAPAPAFPSCPPRQTPHPSPPGAPRDTLRGKRGRRDLWRVPLAPDTSFGLLGAGTPGSLQHPHPLHPPHSLQLPRHHRPSQHPQPLRPRHPPHPRTQAAGVAPPGPGRRTGGAVPGRLLFWTPREGTGHRGEGGGGNDDEDRRWQGRPAEMAWDQA